MRTGALIGAMLLAFVAAPGAIMAFHTAPTPVPVNPAAQKLLDYVNAQELDGVDCRAVHRRVICIDGSGAAGLNGTTFGPPSSSRRMSSAVIMPRPPWRNR